MDNLLGDFNTKVVSKDASKQTVGNETSYEINNNNGVRVVNFTTSKNFVVKGTMSPHRNIHKYTWTSPEIKHNQVDHIFIDRRRHSSILNVRCFRGADCDTDQYLVVEKLRERLAVSKRAAQKIDTERFNLKKLNEEDIKEHHVTIGNKSADLENLRG
jgi:hypothetical protein